MTSAATNTNAASVGDPKVAEAARRDAGRALSRLARTADELNDTHVPVDDERIVHLLSTMATDAVTFDQSARRLAGYSSPVFQEAADDLSDATEALSARWHRLVESRRRALLLVVLSRQSELAALLVSMLCSPTAAAPLPLTALPDGGVPERRARASAAKGSAAQAWEEWSAEQSPPAEAAFMRLAQSWIEGMSAQLARQQQTTLDARSTSEEVADRLRHHLSLISAAGDLAYMDALAAAKRLTTDELKHKP